MLKEVPKDLKHLQNLISWHQFYVENKRFDDAMKATEQIHEFRQKMQEGRAK